MAARYWIGGSGNWDSTDHWSTTSGGSSGASVPTSADDVIFDANSADAAASISLNGATRYCDNFDASAIDQDVTISATGSEKLYVSGSFTGTLGLSISNAQVALDSSDSETFDPDGAFIYSLRVYGSGSFLQLSDLNTNPSKGFAGGFSMWYGAGTWDTDGYLVQVGTFYLYGGTIYLRDSIISVGTWDSVNGTVVAGTSTIVFDQTVADFNTGDGTFNKVIYYNGTHNSSANRINGSPTFADLEIRYNGNEYGSAKSILFDAGATITITNSVYIEGGESGSLYAIGAYNNAGTFTLDFDGVGVIGSDYLSISYCTATPASTWYAGDNSTDGGNNTGWTFDPAPTQGRLTTEFVCSGALTAAEGEGGAISGTVTLTFSEAADLTANGVLEGAITLDFACSADISILPVLITGTISVEFTESADLLATGELAGNSSLDFSEAAALIGVGSLSGEIGLDFTVSGSTSGAAQISGNSDLTFAESADLLATGTLIGESDITFTEDGILTGTGQITGASNTIFEVTGDISSISIGLVGESTIEFTEAGVLTAVGALEGTTTLTSSVSGNIRNANSGIRDLVGSSQTTFSEAGEIKGTGRILTASDVIFTEEGVLTGTGKTEASTSIEFVGSAHLMGVIQLLGGVSLDFTLSADGDRKGTLAGDADAVFTPAGILTGTGSVAVAESLSFQLQGVLTLFGYVSIFEETIENSTITRTSTETSSITKESETNSILL